MRKKKKSTYKINYWILFLVILLVLGLVLSRTRKASKRAVYRHPATEQPVESKKNEADTANKKVMHNIPEICKELLLGKTEPARDTNMVNIKSDYASGKGMFMHKEAYDAFKEMHKAAASDGINLTIISAMRTFNHQKRIWENKWNGYQKLAGDVYATDIDDPVERAREILKYSAMPGTSRHHWGTDVDLNSLQNSYFESSKGKKVYKWLKKHAGIYGFCQPYTPHGKGREGGYEEEKWHWSYLPIAENYLKAFINNTNYDDIGGFNGHETARKIDVINNYVMEIDEACKP